MTDNLTSYCMLRCETVLSCAFVLITLSHTLRNGPISPIWDALGTQVSSVNEPRKQDKKKSRPHAWGRLAAWPKLTRPGLSRHGIYKKSVAVGTVGRDSFAGVTVPKKAPASVHPRRRASRHRGLTDCIVTQKGSHDAAGGRGQRSHGIALTDGCIVQRSFDIATSM